MKNKVILINPWDLSKNKKLPCAFCKKEFTRTGTIAHLVQKHKWKLSDAKAAFKEVGVKNLKKTTKGQNV